MRVFNIYCTQCDVIIFLNDYDDDDDNAVLVPTHEAGCRLSCTLSQTLTLAAYKCIQHRRPRLDFLSINAFHH